MVIIRIKNQNLFRLFKKHPEIAAYYGAEDLDPDSIPKSQKFVMMGMSELQYFFKLPEVFGDERKWRSALSVIKDHYEEVGVPMSEFNKATEPLLAALEKNAGGMTNEQRSNWQEMLKKAYEDMKKWGWY
ncbi:unnamed protein product [Dracunculus medinensis]|uniref:GLOBIN domain-containing protein n=1 Tax=Dracunculus medinensis TaxID=318479 RepID=A0A0N4UMQ3_DRAME|nr:unnamed protein product [Dracunculus medinensis]